MTWLAIAVGCLVITALVFYAGRTGLKIWLGASHAFRQYRPVSFDELLVYLQGLLRDGHDGGFVIIADPRGDKFVQLRKYVHASDQHGLSFDFPRAHWSERYYRKLQSRLEHDGVQFVLQPTLNRPVTEFLQVDCKRNLDLANQLIRLVLIEICDFPQDGRLRVTLENRP